ncbi:MAG TPA: DotU/TssL family secretion system protein [Candidatus Binataceae bacterium]|nr:DotU/TssL family secretion system protein [Candidatus Binataceae bacterium]
MPTLREVFTPLIAYTLFLTEDAAERSRPFPDIRRDIDALLEAQQAMVKREEISEQDYDNARFAVIAWVDEMIMQCPELSGAWRGMLLQAKLYASANAGEEFFDRLVKLSTSQQQVVELYHLALCLGFRGRYYEESQQSQLLDLRRQYGAHLPKPPIDPLDFERRQEHLTPQPYAVSTPSFQTVKGRLPTAWIALPVAAAAALLIWYFYPRRPTMQCLQTAVAGFDCAGIVPSINQQGITLSGHVSSDADHSQVLHRVASQCAARTPVADQLAVIPRPFCQVIEVLDPLKDEGFHDGSALTITPSKGCGGTYYSGDNMVVGVSSKKPLGYLYVDYYDAGRESVTHLLPNSYSPDNALNNAENLTLPGGSYQIRVRSPFGREMVTAVSSPKPLFPSLRPAAEPASDYLASLKEAIKVDGTSSGLAAAYCFTTSSSR